MTIKMKRPYPKQQLFLKAQNKYIAYGGARGGGKSEAARMKAVLLALNYPGIQILLLRRTLKELRENHVINLQKLIGGAARYKDTAKEFIFPNGSRLVLGYCDSERDVLQYQGQAYEVIFMDEATHFTEFQFECLTECNRASGMCQKPFSPRMYFTCNPGGVGHAWVKRLFVDRQFKDKENPDDYVFIPAKVYDNEFLMKNDPGYVRSLENLPELRRKAMLDGDWDIFEGQYFTEFDRELHVIKPFTLPKHWRRYVALDYGLDMLACYWIAVDEHECAYVYRELYKSGLMVSDAARAIKSMSTEEIYARYAPPDLWNRHSDSGMSTAELFAREGVPLIKVSNQRVQGWYNLHEWLRPYEDEQGARTAHLKIFDSCLNLIRTLPALQYDEHNANDTATEPHEITHAPDALRYFVSGRPLPTVVEVERDEDILSYDEQVDSFVGYGR